MSQLTSDACTIANILAETDPNDRAELFNEVAIRLAAKSQYFTGDLMMQAARRSGYPDNTVIHY